MKAATPPAPRTELRTRLVWVTVFRTVAASLLFGALAARILSRPYSADLSTRDSLAFAAEGAVFLLSAIYGLWFRAGRYEAALAWVQVVGDVLIASAVVMLTGGVESPFTFLYLLAILNGSILHPRSGAITAAVASTLLFGAVVAVFQSGLMTPELGARMLDQRELIFTLVSNLLSQGLIAVLATYLARQLLLVGGRAAAREADLKQLAELQRQILASMPSGLITGTRAGQVRFVNRAGRQILGIPESGPPPAVVDELLREARRLRPSDRRAELTVQTATGPRILGLGVSPLAEEGNEDSLLVVFQDLTELRRAETALRRADQLASLGKLAAQLAHEIRNPLASMRGSAQMLADDLPLDSTSARLAKILIRESDRLESLVESFLRFARPPPPAFAPVQLDALLGEITELLRQDPLAREVEISRELPPVEARVDAAQLRQVVVNLLRNAFEAVGPGGKVKVSVQSSPEAVNIRVWDSGGKIGQTEMRHIFEPFFTTRQGGTGLGLSTAQSIISAHGGWIEVTSTPEQGTEFVIRLPQSGSAEVVAS